MTNGPTDRSTPSAVDVLVLSAATGVLVGALHAAYLAARHQLFGRFSETTRAFVWIAPMTYAACFLGAAVVFLLIRRVRGGKRGWPGLVGWCVGWAAISLLLLVPRIHPLAWAVVAIGIGLRLSGIPTARALRWRHVVLRGALVAGVACAFVGVFRAVQPALRERRARQTADRANPGAPNVLLIIWDTVRAANLSTYGYERPTTPSLTRLAEQGVAFDRAFSPASWTLPSHASMMTGVWARLTGTSYLSPTDPSLPTLAEQMGEAGYVTGGFMANAGWAGHESGVGKGFARYETYPLDAGQFLSSSTLTALRISWEILRGVTTLSPGHVFQALRHPDFGRGTPGSARLRIGEEIADRFLAWRDRMGDRQPYFAMLNMMDAHWPYAPPAPYRAMFDGGSNPMAQYDGGIAYMDAQLGRIVQALEDRGELDRTLLIVTSDHGEMFGEHGLNDHGNSVYLPVTHVPLVIRYPARFPPGTWRGDVASLRNLAATVLDVVGLEPTLPGHSMVTPSEPPPAILLHASAGVRQPANFRTANGQVDGVLNAQWHLITNPDSTLELFDWAADPDELENLAGRPETAAVVRVLRAAEASLLEPR